MTVALITNNPQAVVGVFASAPNPLALPNGEQVYGAAVPWTSQDGAYSLVAVTPFSLPAGKETVGSPSYSISGGSVVETYATQTIPAAPAPTPAEIASAALAAGIAIASTSSPALNAIYSVDPGAQANVTAIVTGISAGEGLPGGNSTFDYLDMSGEPHAFTSAQFTTLAAAIRNYVYALDMYGYGQGSQPAASATIP
jgi:hypothetical protein